VDDSVHILVPEFPNPDISVSGIDAIHDGIDDIDAGDYGDGEDSENRDLRPEFLRRRRNTQARTQFTEGSRRIPMSYPRVHSQVNQDLFEASESRVPNSKAEATVGGSTGEDEDDDDDDSAAETRREAGSKKDDISYGVGSGVISGAGSGYNHVVSIAWSPTGFLPNRRPILAVLTSLGMLVMYGDGVSPSGQDISTGVRSETGMLKQRNLSSWAVLWGVGERLTLPGQGPDVHDNIQSFAWSGEVSPGEVLLAYINDSMEVAIIRVKSDRPKGVEDDARDNKIWHVREVARFKVDGPHPSRSVYDVDYVPQGTSFGLRFSPWLFSEDSQTCVLSYICRGYVGFRKITVSESSASSTELGISVDDQDTYGKCVFLSSDSFVEFEDAIWTKSESKIVRGLIVTGFSIESFQVTIAGSSDVYKIEQHTPYDCGTAYPDPEDKHRSDNPIQDLVIHSPNPMKPTPAPIYSLIRLSATPTTKDWYETNDPGVGYDDTQATGDTRPHWAIDIAQKLDVSIPVDMYATGNLVDGGEVSEDGDSEADETMRDADGDDDVYEGQVSTVQVKEVRPYRFWLYGLALSPNSGRMSAILAAGFSTQQSERRSMHSAKCTLMFDSMQRNRRVIASETHTAIRALRPSSTESRMLAWMYDAGPDVPGVTVENLYQQPGQETRTSELFLEAVKNQKCNFCGESMTLQEGQSICAKGHFFSTCGTSGLAIQAPGISRSCGICGTKTLKRSILMEHAPNIDTSINREIMDGICGRCGGKFVD
jgi:hypothetical protein